MSGADNQREHTERTKERFRARYEEILGRRLTPANVSEYAHDVHTKMQVLKENIENAYSKLHPEASVQGTAKYVWARVGNIDTILKNATLMHQRVHGDIDALITQLQKLVDTKDIPLARLRFDRIVLPYLVTLSHILERDFDIPTEELSFGYTASPEQTLWCRVPELNRILIYALDTSHMHAHILDLDALSIVGLTQKDMLSMPARERDEYVRTSPTIGRIIDTDTHIEALRSGLHQNFSDYMPVRSEPKIPRASVQELDSRRAPYEQFSEEVAFMFSNLEPMPQSIQDWYHSLKESRPSHWPSNPQKYYSPRGRGRSGWVSWPALVGSDVPEPLPYSELQEAVTRVWTTAGKPKNIQEWYFSIASQYRSKGWPGNPENFYKAAQRGKVWQSWRRLVGEQNRAGQLPYSDFKNAVRLRWIADGEQYPIDRWYRSLNPRPRGWDSNPQQVYKKNHPRYKEELGGDWQGWSDLVGVPDGRTQTK